MLLDRMVQLETSCLRRLAQGREEIEIRFGRLLRNPRVGVAQIIAGWSEETAPAAAGRHVLAIQDTSEIHFRTTERQRRGLGVIGKGSGRGLLLHPMLAVDAASGECLGLVGGTVWTRLEPELEPADKSSKKRNQQRPLDEKESRHWIETAQAAEPALAAAAMVTMTADREADLYPLWALVPHGNVHVLGRVYHDRKLATGGTLTMAARDWPVLGTRRLRLREREGRPEREAELELRTGSVTLLRPRWTREPGLPKQLTLTLIELSELNPPAGAEAVTPACAGAGSGACSPPMLCPIPPPLGNSSIGIESAGSSSNSFAPSRNRACRSKTVKSRPPTASSSSLPLPPAPR
jgi:hypothetical protein